MSWTTASLFINEGPSGYLGAFPTHSLNKARSLLLEELGVQYSQSRLSNFDAGIRPPSGWFCVGAYDKAVVLSGYDELYGVIESAKQSPIRALIESYQKAEILLFELAGGSNYFAFEIYSSGHLERGVAGDPERGIVVNKGNLTPEEQALGLAGESTDQLITHGETLVFELTKRFLGVPLDRFAAEKLVVELIKKRSGLLSRFAFRQ